MNVREALEKHTAHQHIQAWAVAELFDDLAPKVEVALRAAYDKGIVIGFAQGIGDSYQEVPLDNSDDGVTAGMEEFLL